MHNSLIPVHNLETSDERIPDILLSEVIKAIEDTKAGKAPEPDDLEIDVIKNAGEPLAKELVKMFNRCIEKRKAPQIWKESKMVLLFKKGNSKDLKNYRPISLLLHIYKIFTKIITKRMEKKMEEALTRKQAGFRSSFSTMDHIHTINQIREKCNRYNLPLCLTFVDFEKAFDSIETESILQSLLRQGIDLDYINILKDIYTNCISMAMRDNKDIKICINKGVRQGDTISPKPH